MKKKKLGFELEIYKTLDELTKDDRQLLEAALEAKGTAYAPYSNFKVGAAVLLSDGNIVIGSNQENASYPSGLCAERVAVFQAGAKYPNATILSIAITVDAPEAAAPCGNCRQSISEYEQKQDTPVSILMMGASGEVWKTQSIGDLLPLTFGNSYLE